MKITKQRLKKIIKEELEYAMEAEEGGAEDPATSKNALANFFKDKYGYLLGSESSDIKLQTAEIKAIAQFVDALLKIASQEGNATRDLLVNLQRLMGSTSGKGMGQAAEQPGQEAAPGEKETITV